MPADSLESTQRRGKADAPTPNGSTGVTVARPIRIEPAFDDREFVRTLFSRRELFRAVAEHLPDGYDETAEPRPPDSIYPWFRETWAVGGRVIVGGAERILANPRFLAAAHELFPAARIVPKLVVVNVNAPMPAGLPHIDVPVFRGATREEFAPRLLLAMGASGLFEPWRIFQVGAVAWFYDGPGGGFDYWPDGPDGPMRTERPPFGNVAIVADGDRMYHRIGRIGAANAVLPRMSATAEIRLEPDGAWSIFDQEERRACYPKGAVRRSVVWKAEVHNLCASNVEPEPLTAPRIFELLQKDLRRRRATRGSSLALLNDQRWIEHVCRLHLKAAQPQGLSVRQ